MRKASHRLPHSRWTRYNVVDMDAEALWTAVFFLGLFAVIGMRFVPKKNRVFITDYQKGVRFIKGSFAGILGPGSYLSGNSEVEITVVDMRPFPFLIERFFYQDGLQAPSVISISAELSVSDSYRAVTGVKDRIADSIAIVRDALHSCTSRMSAELTSKGRYAMADKVTVTANAELNKIGMAIANVEVTELWSRPMPAYPSLRAN